MEIFNKFSRDFGWVLRHTNLFDVYGSGLSSFTGGGIPQVSCALFQAQLGT
jgi:hypothetical protein